MKRIILLMLVAIITLPAIAQNKKLFDQLTEKYSDKTGFSASMLTSDLFDLYIKKKDIEENSPVFTALKELDAIVVISQNTIEYLGLKNDPAIKDLKVKEEAQKVQRNEMFDEINEYYKNNQYILFKTENQAGEDLKVYLKKENDQISSLALITNSSATTNLVELDGDIDLATVAELNKALNLRGLEKLYKLNGNSTYIGTYGADVRSISIANGLSQQLGIQERNLIEQQLNLASEQRGAIEDQMRAAADKQAQMAEKMRQMTEIYGRQPILLSTPGDTNTVYYINGKKVKAKDVKELDKTTISGIELKNPEKEGDKTEVKIKTRK